MFVSVLISILAVIAIGLGCRRIWRRRAEPSITDAMIRQIEAEGSVEVDEALDLDEIREEEERFWAEPWNEPEEW